MCGITGVYAFNLVGRLHLINLSKATQAISSRGPDFQNTYAHEHVGLGHRRLSIIDTSYNAHQPMSDASGRYVLVYNGEIYNFREIRMELKGKGLQFKSESDTEVLLYTLIHEGLKGLDRLNGFFAFAFYDSFKDVLIIARDRYGIKPLVYFHDDDKFIFASELKSVFEYGIDKKLDWNSLALYLQLNYIPAPNSILQKVKKLEPGHYITITKGKFQKSKFYQPPEHVSSYSGLDYQSKKAKLRELLEQSVRDRLYADVPLGTFLSGGIDSSVITAVAAGNTDHLHSFSIGYKDEPFFDESRYAIKVAKHLNTEHTVFSLSNRDLYEHLFEILDYFDEPFADSSSIAVNILSRETRNHVTVALSGDGADELFGGYNKHKALFRMMHPGKMDGMIANMGWLWALLPKSRNSAVSNRFRQLSRFAEASKLPPDSRYWMLASFLSRTEATSLLVTELRTEVDHQLLDQVQNNFTGEIPTSGETMDQYLRADLKLVLPNDMLTKVDSMSMAHGLEVRVPFLDQNVVEFALSLDDGDKVDKRTTKKILKDTFKDVLPNELYYRPKRGFEVPLLKWFKRELKTILWEDLLADDFVRDQGIFDPLSIQKLRRKLNSRDPSDSHATVWALLVFQRWYKKYFV